MISKKRLVIFVSFILVVLVLFIKGVNAATPMSAPMKVTFYHFDKKTRTKGKLAGSAILKNGMLDIKTNDPELKKLLRSEIMVKGGAVKKEVMPNGKEVFVGGVQMYKPGTREHLEAIVRDAESYGYYAETNASFETR